MEGLRPLRKIDVSDFYTINKRLRESDQCWGSVATWLACMVDLEIGALNRMSPKCTNMMDTTRWGSGIISKMKYRPWEQYENGWKCQEIILGFTMGGWKCQLTLVIPAYLGQHLDISHSVWLLTFFGAWSMWIYICFRGDWNNNGREIFGWEVRWPDHGCQSVQFDLK